MLKKKNLLFGENSKINQILCAILINLPVISYGASIGWMSPMSLLLQSKDSPKGVPLTDTEISWMAAIPYLICIPANTVIAYFVDKYGRKLALILVSLAGAASWALLLVSLDISALIIARALVGITMSGCYIICPIYTKEISEDSIRGALGCFIILFHTIGNLLLYVMGDLLNYYQILWACLAVPIIHLSLFVFMPDSPSYLVKTGKVERATKAIAWLRCRPEADNVVQEEINLINEEHKKDSEANQFFLKTIFTDKILFKAFQIAMISTLAREVCGAIPVLNFAGEIFTLASSDNKSLILSPNQQAMLLGAVQVVGSIIASGLVEKCGRKPLLFISSLISGLSMCVVASWFLMRDYDVITPSWIPLFTLCLCIFCDSSGLQPMSVVLSGEIFSFKYRGTVMATAMCGSSLSDFLQLLFFKPLANSIGIHVAFYFFGLVCLFMAAYVIIVIPETRARTLEDIYQDLGKKQIPEENCNKEVTRV